MLNVTESQKQLLDRAAVAQQNKDHVGAVQILRGLLKESPDLVAAHAQLGILAAELGQHRAAEQHLVKVTQLAPQVALGWRNLTAFHIRRKQWRAAMATVSRQLALTPEEVPALRQLMQIQHSLKDHKSALQTVDRLLAMGPKTSELLLLRADTLVGLHRDDEALALYDSLRSDPQIPLARFENWVRLCIRFERSAEAIEWIKQRLKAEPQSIEGHLMLCGTLIPEGRYAESLESLRIAEKIAPEHMRIHHDLGVVLRFLGQIEASQVHMAKALEKDPYHVSALRVFGAEHKYEYGDAAFSRLMRAAVHLGRYAPEGKVQLHYALGKAFDDLGDLAVAFDHYVEAGRVHLQNHPKDDGSVTAYHAAAKSRLTADVLQKPAQAGCDSDLPVFILGMPRSGTSLAEQVLASHPEVFGAGELKHIARVMDGIVVAQLRVDLQNKAPIFPKNSDAPWQPRGEAYVEYLRSCAPKGAKYKRIIDKMPGNYMWAGLIHLILPKAKIIHTRRHPVETCLSAFRIFFPDGLYWSYDLKKMGTTYRQYSEIMAHWREGLPTGVMHEVRYEDMVNDLPTHAKQLVAHCGLEWNEACLSFHETDRPVRTASASQVRQPVYKTSMNRWRKYEPYLGPLMKELGPLVKAYEDELAATP